MVVTSFCHRRPDPRLCWHGSFIHTLAVSAQAAQGMKVLAACILAIALMFRAAPICAAPVQNETIGMMPNCEGAPNHHDEQRGQKGDDVARACHACAFAPVAIAVLTKPALAVEILSISASEQLASGVLEPPTPPPRGVSRTIFSTYNWS